MEVSEQMRKAEGPVTVVEKPRLGFWQIWNMSFGFLGIQFGFALQNANVSRIFETLGASIDDIPILWIAAPLTGLLVQPIIGYMSDHTWGRLGRRRVYFLTGAIMATIALFIMPNSPVLWVAAGMLWILDASINVSMEPFRALIGDMLPSSQRATGFAAQSFFIGVGAVVASLLPYLLTNIFGIDNTAPAGEIPPSVKYSFYLGGLAFLGAVVWTVLKTREYSPEEMEKYVAPRHTGEKEATGFLQILRDFITMPATMVQLAFVQFFSWFALFCLWIYSVPAVTNHIYGTTDPTSAAYNEGANWVGVCFGVYNGFAAVVAFLLPVLARRSSRKIVHAGALIAGGIGMASLYIISNPDYIVISMLGVGLAWASILSLPYAILAGALPSHKMGVYMGIFNFFIVLPQIIAAGVLGYMVNNFFGGEAIYALVTGGVSLLLAALLVFFVHDVDADKAVL